MCQALNALFCTHFDCESNGNAALPEYIYRNNANSLNVDTGTDRSHCLIPLKLRASKLLGFEINWFQHKHTQKKNTIRSHLQLESGKRTFIVYFQAQVSRTIFSPFSLLYARFSFIQRIFAYYNSLGACNWFYGIDIE